MHASAFGGCGVRDVTMDVVCCIGFVRGLCYATSASFGCAPSRLGTGLALFPRAHTCFNRIDLPSYSDPRELKLYLESVLTMDMDQVAFGLE